MLNRNKLVQLSLSEIPSETEYLDYKKQIDITSDTGRAKLIRLICAMNHSNPNAYSFIFVGIGDDKSIIGTPFLDDANFQNAVKDFINNCPKLSYENINFKGATSEEFIGIITIYPSEDISYIAKNIWKLKKGDKFIRRGSTTEKYNECNEQLHKNTRVKQNQFESNQLTQKATVSLGSTLDAVLSFYSKIHKEYSPRHYVFNDQYVVGISSWYEDSIDCHSEVTISVLNEEVIYFWSALEHVKIECLEQYIVIEEQALVFWGGDRIYFPFKLTKLDFSKLGTYSIQKELIFSIPHLTIEEISYFIDNISSKLKCEKEYIEILPYELLLAALNGSHKAVRLLCNKNNSNLDGTVAESYREAILIYNTLQNSVLFP